VVADLVRACGHQVAGYVDMDPAKRGRVVEPGGGRVLLTEAEFTALARDGRLPAGVDAVALAIGDNRRRLACLAELNGIPAPPLQHPFSFISPSAELGRASVVFAGVVINADARLGDAVIVNSSAVVEHDCEIGDGVHLSPRATLAGGVRVGARSWVGAGATVIQRLSIGADCMVGAGATVIRDVLDGQAVVGNPARVIRG
jgi:sugar O-acyltransferase (sialic acid O-acetyltransferase NeuD family)